MGFVNKIRSLASRGVAVAKSVSQRAVPILSGLYSASKPIQSAVSSITQNLMNPKADKIGGIVNKAINIGGTAALMASQGLQLANRGHLYQNVMPG